MMLGTIDKIQFSSKDQGHISDRSIHDKPVGIPIRLNGKFKYSREIEIIK